MIFKIIILFLLAVICRIYLTKYDVTKINKISKQFDDIVNTNGESEDPSNAEFNKLYKKAFGNAERIAQTRRLGTLYGQRAIFTDSADVLASFPTLHPQVIRDEINILSNLKDYYQDKYSENFSPAFWIRSIIFLPGSIVKYVGLKDNSITARIFNLVYWFLVPLGSVMRLNLINLVHQLLK